MKHYIGLDVAVKETAVCVVDENGVICREAKVASHPDDLIAFLRSGNWNIVRIGLEAGLVAMAARWFGGGAASGLQSDLHRDAPCQGLLESPGQQERPQ